jgi:nicotinate-nucleotide pyrophosphorylase (carboxylating)
MIIRLDPVHYRDLVARALDEDLGAGDITTEATVEPDRAAHGVFVAKSNCIVAGLETALETMRQAAERVSAASMPARGLGFTIRRHDGIRCAAGDPIAEVLGPARALLAGERTSINFLQRLSGIATLAGRYVAAAGGRLTVLDTRKTTPTLRALEKYAVAVGGASNHRTGLHDAFLIKDNHLRVAGGVARAVARARAYRPQLPIEVEVQTLDELDAALTAGAEIVLVDNMAIGEIREAVRRAHGRATIEISGGVTLENIPALAATGAECVSVGALTHSAPAADISFEMEPR